MIFLYEKIGGDYMHIGKELDYEFCKMQEVLVKISKLMGKDDNYLLPQIIEASQDYDLEQAVENILKDFGMSTSLKGYKNLKTACMLSFKDNDLLNLITKALYPMIAKLYKTTSDCVEKNIRHAIETTFDKIDPDVITEFFGYAIDKEKGKPTNTEFITTVCNKLKNGYLL